MCTYSSYVRAAEHSHASTELDALLRSGAGAGLPWTGVVAYSPGTAHSCGVATLLSAAASKRGIHVQQQATDTEGRVVCVDLDVQQHRLRVVNAYAPAQGPVRRAWLPSLADYLETDRELLLGGDFNCVVEAADESVPSACRRQGAAELGSLMAAFGLVDAWPGRGRGPGFTHVATNAPGSAARLDRWLVGPAAQPWVAGIQLVQGVLLRLRLPDLPPLGRRGWSLPTYLLYHPSLLAQLQAAVAAQVVSLSTGEAADARDVWEALKAFLRATADHLHRQHSREQAEELFWQQQTAAAALASYSLDTSVVHRQQALRHATTQLKAQVRKEAVAMCGAAEALYGSQGEQGTRWFHSLGRAPRAEQQPIVCLQVPGDAAPASLAQADFSSTISRAATAHFSSDAPTGLFRPGAVDVPAQQTLLAQLRRTLPPELQQAAEGPAGDGSFVLSELAAALQGCAPGKAPGTDGLPYEVYKVLWPQLGPLLLAAVNAALGDALVDGPREGMAAALPGSWLEGLIALVYKGKQLPRELLPSYRPLTLLNADFKVLSKAVGNRLQGPLDYLVDALQTAFLDGRWIGENVLYHLGLREYLQQSAQPGALLLLDLEKAYDLVDRDWVLTVAQAMGFGAGMRRWLRLLLAPATARACVNGHLSEPFPVRNGLTQGSPLSPPLWVLQLEPLTAYLHHLASSGLLRTPSLPDGSPAPPVAHHADDTKLLVSDADVDGPVAKAAVQLYCRASNGRENASKAKGVVLGTHAPVVGRHAATGAYFPGPDEDPPKLLGVPLCADMDRAAGLCYDTRLASLEHLSRCWRQHELSMVGRVHVAKQVLANALVYHLCFVPPTAPQLQRVCRLLDNFVAWSFLPEDASLVSHGRATLRPKCWVAQLAPGDGGIGHVDLPSFAAALQAKTVALLALPGQQPWKLLTRFLLAAAAPAGTTGWGWVYSTAPLPQPGGPLSDRLLAAAQAHRHCRPGRLPPPPDVDGRALLCEPLFYNPLILDAAQEPLVPPPGWPADGPMSLGQWRQLAATPGAGQQPDGLDVVAGALPAAWQALLADPLWTVLRLCFLHAVWCVHMDRDRTAHHAHAVVAHTVAALRHLMWAQFRMTALSDALLEPLPTRLLSAQLKADRLADFSAVWAWRRVLCEVELPPAGAAEGPRLRVFLSLAAPVPAPAAPAPAGPLGGQAGV
ncbi:Transposon TX1 uncharacterized protein [Tetrabaena socialis]|uniref:Transposon TX1 uncharacterized protein n=1 Tax=Tetrabaena socialis TaxID=47790 RepID=A0A2J7ZXW5_9CHLO|nr:Transposon TX1 uncharacterized protein [Tetrabaena socialis]|eukprot:PNH05108.1 Transposon TX1 uncharacterized protein [Tetrabaena socialis]